MQNIYQQGSQFRNIRLNATGIVLFKFYGGVDSNRRLLRDLGMKTLIDPMIFEEIYSDRYQYIYIDLHPNRQYVYSSLRGNIFDIYYKIFYKMEYIAIPKADFLKYFKIIEAKKGKIKAVKNGLAIKKIKRKRTRSPTPDSKSSATEESLTSESE